MRQRSLGGSSGCLLCVSEIQTTVIGCGLGAVDRELGDHLSSFAAAALSRCLGSLTHVIASLSLCCSIMDDNSSLAVHAFYMSGIVSSHIFILWNPDHDNPHIYLCNLHASLRLLIDQAKKAEPHLARAVIVLPRSSVELLPWRSEFPRSLTGVKANGWPTAYCLPRWHSGGL